MVTPAEQTREFPTAGSYQEALQHPRLCFTHAELRESIPELTKLRQPRAISGAFASVFPLTHTATGQRYAVKCFTRYVPDQQARYRAISEKLAGLSSSALSQPWKVGFDYLPDAVLVGASRYPVLKMDWVQGTTLSAWLDTHHGDSRGVDRLAELFAELISDLAVHGIGHGDLQHGNLLVADDGTLRLLDYDGMFVPALAGHNGTERGHRNYQSPRRGDHDFGADVDRFSAWVIYLALKSIAIDPGLWGQLHAPLGEYLLLTDEDFKDPSTSQRFPALLSHSDGQIRSLAELVRGLVWHPLTDLPALAVARAKAVSAPVAPPPAAAGNGGLPGWMSGHLTPSTAPSTVGTQTTLGAISRFAGRQVIDYLAAVLMIVTLVSTIVCVVLGIPVAIVLPLVAGTVGAVWAGRRSRAEYIAVRQRHRDLRARRAEAAKEAGAAAEIRKELAHLDRSELHRLSQLPGRRDQMRHHYNKELAAIEAQRIAATADLDRRVSALDRQLQEALNAALRREQYEFIHRELERSTVSDASIPGIGKKLTQDLANHGIRTAADFTLTRLSPANGYNNSATVEIIRSDGRAVHINGIGEIKASDLMAWRNVLVSNAQARCPVHTPRQGAAITSQFAAGRRQLDSERQNFDTITQSGRSQAKQRLEAGLTHLADEAATTAQAAANQRENCTGRLVKVQKAQTELTWMDARLAETREHKRVVSSARYCRFVLLGK